MFGISVKSESLTEFLSVVKVLSQWMGRPSNELPELRRFVELHQNDLVQQI